MKKFLLPHLICPACLPAEHPLAVSVKRIEDNDIISGDLSCKKCRQSYPIKDGIAYLLHDRDGRPGGDQMRYEDSEMISRYLWTHYGDLAGAGEVATANEAWAGLLADSVVSSLDTGCAVGRLTFEMAARSGWAVGCDLSAGFVRMARRLARDRRCIFSLPLEGNLQETFKVSLPDSWRSDNLDFVVADAQAAPFARGTFQQASSMNLLDRVCYPLAHLHDINRVLRPDNAAFAFADPFSWSVYSSPEERWLGGTSTGEYAGRGIDNVRSLLLGKNKIMTPIWRIEREGQISWQMRTHTNHREVIRSEYILAVR